MDNLTHSLIGLLLARAAGRHIGSLRGALFTAILASNLPDADIVLGPLFDDRKLGYLVHHRGYTHTLVGALGLALVAAGIGAWRDRAARRGPLVALAIVAALLHIGADGWNNYGVHPFWPVDPDWKYGDCVFIAEPLLWCALLPLVWMHGRVGRWVWGIGVAAMTLVSGALIGVGTASGLLAMVAGLTWVQRTEAGVRIPAVVSVLVLAAFMAGRGVADRALRSLPADGEILDVVLTPGPARPWCWEAIRTTLDGDRYTLTRARVSLIADPTACALPLGDGRTAPMIGEWRPSDDPRIVLGPAFEGSVAHLRAIDAESCRVDAVMRFARAPFYTDAVIGDLRYDFEPGLGFAEFEIAGAGCVEAPWRSAVGRRLLGE